MHSVDRSESKNFGDVQVELADRSSLEVIQTLLRDNQLPFADVEPHIENFLIAKDGSRLVGVAGIEVHGGFGLLRSVCVDADYRGQHRGSKLCDLIEAHARNIGITHLYLLTTTAALFFVRRGFMAAAREGVPLEIKQTEEFKSLCPATATCMMRRLDDGAFHLPKSILPLRPDVSGARMWAASLKNTMLTYFEVEPNTRFEIHVHEGEQITSVIDGQLYFELEEGTVCVGQGEVMAIPPGVKHAVFTREKAARAFDAWSPPPPRYQSLSKP